MGVAPLKKMIDVVEGITSLDALTEYFVKTPAEDRLFCLWYDENVQDMDHAGTQILSIKRGYSLLGDPEEYRGMTGKPRSKSIQIFSDECWKSSATARKRQSRSLITVLRGRH